MAPHAEMGVAHAGGREETVEETSLPLPPSSHAPDESRVRGQDTADLYHFFRQTQASSVGVAGQVRMRTFFSDHPD